MDLKDNSCLLFENHKRTSERAPALKGEALIDGDEKWASGWIKKSKSGEKYFSISFTSKKQRNTSRVQDDLDAETKKEEGIPY